MANFKSQKPPQWALRFFRWFCHPEYREDVEGDLRERFVRLANKQGSRAARWRFIGDVLLLFRPAMVRISFENHMNTMINHYLKVSYRTLVRNKMNSLINIGGLTLGMTVAIIIGLWIQDELTYNQNHENYSHIARVLRHNDRKEGIITSRTMVPGLGTLLKTEYGNYFESVGMIRQRIEDRVISFEDKIFTQTGYFVQPEIPEMLTLKMIHGSRSGLGEMSNILLSKTVSDKLFGDRDPIGQIVQMDANWNLKVTGVYEDLPVNSELSAATFLATLDRYNHGWSSVNVWDNYYVWIFVKVRPGHDPGKISEIIESAMLPHVGEHDVRSNPRLFLHPMSRWHLHNQFEDGEEVMSLQLKYVWFYGIIGIFILILACINFTNLSTARAEKRAKEIGMRKALGSNRVRLIHQFLLESLIIGFLSFVFSVCLAWLFLPEFNNLAIKKLEFPFSQISFWTTCIAFTVFTSLLAGSYPAFYLSSVKTLKVLKGHTLTLGKVSSLPRKILVVFQFTISISMIAGTLIVYKQIELAKKRPIGYQKEHLISFQQRSPEYRKKYDVLKNELKQTGVVREVGSANYSITSTLGWNNGFSWKNQQAGFDPAFNTIRVSHGYSKAVGMGFIYGRDFSPDLANESASILINESALKVMGLEHPVGKKVSFEREWLGHKQFTIIGVVRDMIKGSPFEPTDPSIIFLDNRALSNFYIRVNPNVNPRLALGKIEGVFKAVIPSAAFNYKFADEEYHRKFLAEERISQLAGYFAILTIFISCLGLLGLSSFITEQRTKEIGIRKVLGATAANLMRLLSFDYVILVVVSSLLAVPISYYFLNGWLSGYSVKTEISWWIFALAGVSALIITLFTVGYQAIKAAFRNPVESLRYE